MSTDLLKQIVVLDSKDLDKQLFSFKLHGNDVNGKELYFNGLIQFSPDGKYVIFHTSNRLYVMDAYTGENKLSMEILDNQIGGIAGSVGSGNAKAGFEAEKCIINFSNYHCYNRGNNYIVKEQKNKKIYRMIMTLIKGIQIGLKFMS